MAVILRLRQGKRQRSVDLKFVYEKISKVSFSKMIQETHLVDETLLWNCLKELETNFSTMMMDPAAQKPQRRRLSTPKTAGALTRQNLIKLGDNGIKKPHERSISSVSTVSSRLYDANFLQNRDKARLRQKSMLETKDCTFKPVINKSSMPYRRGVIARLSDCSRLKQRQAAQERRKEELELQGCTFQPQLATQRRRRQSIA